MKKKIFLVILSCLLVSVSACNDLDADSYVASDSTDLAIGTYYSTYNLLNVKSIDETFGDSTFADATFFNSSFEETVNYSTEDDYLSNYSTVDNDYIAVSFSFEDSLNAPIKYSNYVEVGTNETKSFSRSGGEYNGYSYQDLMLSSLTESTSDDTKNSYFDVTSSVSNNICTTVESVIGSDALISENTNFTETFTCPNITGETEILRFELRVPFQIFEIAVYKKLSDSVYELEETFHQYSMNENDYTIEEVSRYSKVDGLYNLYSECRMSNYYYFD